MDLPTALVAAFGSISIQAACSSKRAVSLQSRLARCPSSPLNICRENLTTAEQRPQSCQLNLAKLIRMKPLIVSWDERVQLGLGRNSLQLEQDAWRVFRIAYLTLWDGGVTGQTVA